MPGKLATLIDIRQVRTSEVFLIGSPSSNFMGPSEVFLTGSPLFSMMALMVISSIIGF